MTIHELDHATFHGLDCAKDFERGILEAQTPQDALRIAARIREVLSVLQAADLLAHNRADVLSGIARQAQMSPWHEDTELEQG